MFVNLMSFYDRENKVGEINQIYDEEITSIHHFALSYVWKRTDSYFRKELIAFLF